jgi:type I restriction enzyme S subunit
MTPSPWASSVWPITPLGRFAEKIVRGVPADSEVVTAFRDGFVGPRSMRREEGFTFSDLEQGYQGVQTGDLVFHGLDGFAGAFGVAVAAGRCTPVYHVIRCEHDDSRYVAYALRVAAAADLLEVQVPSTRQRAVDFRNWSTLSPLGLPRPSLDEQRAIADFLDDQVARIEAIIAAREQQASLVEDQARARVEELIFPHNVQARPVLPMSSADYADPFARTSLPCDWKRFRLRQLLNKRGDVSGGVGRLLSVFLDRGVVPFDEAGPDRVHNPSLDLGKYQMVKISDLVMNNQQAWRGSVGVSSYAGIISPAYHVYALDDVLDPYWANFAFRSRPMVFLYEQVSRGVGNIQRNLDGTGLLSLPIVVPDKTSQRRSAVAASHIETEASQTLQGLRDSVRLLREFSGSLMAAAVTGEFDVASASRQGAQA